MNHLRGGKDEALLTLAQALNLLLQALAPQTQALILLSQTTDLLLEPRGILFKKSTASVKEVVRSGFGEFALLQLVFKPGNGRPGHLDFCAGRPESVAQQLKCVHRVGQEVVRNRLSAVVADGVECGSMDFCRCKGFLSSDEDMIRSIGGRNAWPGRRVRGGQSRRSKRRRERSQVSIVGCREQQDR